MTTFRCERYPKLRVVDNRDPNRYLAVFTDGFFQTDDPYIISVLRQLGDVQCIEGEVPAEQPEPPLASSEMPPLPQEDKTKLLQDLVEEALELGVLRRQGQRILFGRRLVGESVFHAAHKLRVAPKMVQEIVQKCEQKRTEGKYAKDSRGLREEEDLARSSGE